MLDRKDLFAWPFLPLLRSKVPVSGYPAPFQTPPTASIPGAWRLSLPRSVKNLSRRRLDHPWQPSDDLADPPGSGREISKSRRIEGLPDAGGVAAFFKRTRQEQRSTR
jgi:hypothetical protein